MDITPTRRASHTTPRRPDLLTAEHDLDGIPTGTVPARSIVVCMPPGVDSNPVADLLQRHGGGVPMEYFDIDAVAEPLAQRWHVFHLDDYVAALHRHRSADTGVFGLVLRWRGLRRLHRQVAGLKQLTAERLQLIVTTIAPNPTFVLVRGSGPQSEADTTPGQRDVKRQHALLEATERTWLQWFDATGIRALQVTVGPGGALSPPEDALLGAVGLVSRTGR